MCLLYCWYQYYVSIFVHLCVFVSAGYVLTMCAVGGQIYSWGRGGYGRLGHDGQDDVLYVLNR